MSEPLNLPASGASNDVEAMAIESDELVARCRAGDTVAFSRLVGDHQRGVYGYVLSMVRDSDVADDLTQETFVKAWRGIGSFRGESAVRTWLFQIAANRVRTWGRWRRLRVWRETALDAVAEDGESPVHQPRTTNPADDPARGVESIEISRRLRAAVAQLPPREREVFVLRHEAHLPLKDIARALDIAEGSVKAHLSHALDKLRRTLEE